MPVTAIDPRTPIMHLLERLGPEAAGSAAPEISLAEADAYCRGLTESHYENFSVLTGLVPVELRRDFAAVYAFCRWSDDLGDETGSDAAARERSKVLLAWWRSELLACHAFAGGGDGHAARPTHPVFVALSETFARHPHLGARPFDDLIRAFEQDQTVTRYQTWEELLGYCRLSADPVGRIVLTLAGYAPPEIDPSNAERYRLSDLTCSALQLINFWQDVRRDLIDRDRVYLPATDTGIDAETLRTWLDPPGSLEPANRIRYIRAVRGLVERTRVMFDEAAGLPALLSPEFAPVVRLFGDGGRSVMHAVLRSGCTTLWRRPKLSKATKVSLIARAWLSSRRAVRSAGQ